MVENWCIGCHFTLIRKYAIDPVTNIEIADSRSCARDNTDELVREVILIKSTGTETQVLPVQTDNLQLDLNPILRQRLPELGVWPEVKGGENARSLEGCTNRTKTALRHRHDIVVIRGSFASMFTERN